MKVSINDTEIIFPSSLSEMTLGQRIDFHKIHGKYLENMVKAIIELPEGPNKEAEVALFSFEQMVRSFSFFANIPVDVVRDNEFLDQIASIYYSCLAVLFQDEQELELQHEFAFKGEMWFLERPEMSQGSKFTYGEFIDAKQLIQDAIALGHGKWEYMQKICAIYLRKKDEQYDKRFLYEDSERLKLMRDLPMDIAMQVGFFLTATMNFYINTSSSSESQEQKVPADIQKRIMIAMAG